MNVAPSPSPRLAACTDPPCSSTRCLTIDRPRPRPPNRRVIDRSAWWKRSKTCGSTSGRIPTPVSLTLISAVDRVLGQRHLNRPPRGVNLIAFDSRFQTDLLQPGRITGDGSDRVVRRPVDRDPLGFGVALPPSRWRRPSSVRRSTLCVSRRSLPDTIRLMSSRSAMSWACDARVAGNDVQAAVEEGRGPGGRLRHQLRPAKNRVEGRPQLVRDHGHELVLYPARTLRLAAGDALGLEESFPIGGGDLPLGFAPSPFGDVAKHQHDARRSCRRAPGSAPRCRRWRAPFRSGRHQQRVVRRADRAARRERLRHRAVGHLPCLLADEADDLIARPADSRPRTPSGQLLRHRVHERDAALGIAGDDAVADAVQGDAKPLLLGRQLGCPRACGR